MKAIGDRMKANYEDRQQYMLTRRTPVIIRVDGKAFHTYTRGMARPFDPTLVRSMIEAASAVMAEAQGCKLAYVQSDEASFLLTDYDTLNTEAWFGYCKSKVETVTASCMTAAFNRAMGRTSLALFDARSFNIPREEVANYFLWRALDWQRNSVSMYCAAFHSPKQMHRKGAADQHEMLHAIGKNWTTDLHPTLRNGTFILRGGETRDDVLPTYLTIAALTTPLVDCDSATEEVDR